MSEHAIVESHVLDVDEGGFFRLLRETFTNSTTFLAELLQNGRRAGATRIAIEWDPDHTVMTVSDDGHGIGNFKPLFVACKSAWEPEIKFREDPFGVGLFAALYASVSVEIHSLDRLVTLDESLFNNCPVYVKTAPQRIGTQLRLTLRAHLRRKTAEWRTVILALVKGFPIPVSFNGEELPRPHALDSGLPFRSTEIGALYLEGWQPCQPIPPRSMPMLYCQGLPMCARDSHRQNGFDVLHVATTRFRARSPDRHMLHEADTNEPVIERAIVRMWQERLIARRQELSPQDFVDAHWRLCIVLGLPELLQDMPLSVAMLERCVASIYADCQSIRMDDFRIPWDLSRPNEDGLFVTDLFGSGYCGEEHDPPGPLASIYALVRELPLLRNRVPACHPSRARSVDLLDPSLGLEYELHGESGIVKFDGWRSCSVQICARYTIRFRPTPGCRVDPELRRRLTPVEVSTFSFFDPHKQRIIVPSGDDDLGDVLKQVANYCDEYDHFQDGDHERDQDELRSLVDYLRGPSPDKYLASLLARTRPNVQVLGESWFRVCFDSTKKAWEVAPE
jgi:hypothetical protein